MLNDVPLIAFLPTRDGETARRFYEHVLGLGFVSDDGFALVSRNTAETMIRLARMEEFTPAPFTILGWEVTDIEQKAHDLASRGVACLRSPFLEQDEDGIWTAPTGDKVLWFKDPDGNTLSLSQHV